MPTSTFGRRIHSRAGFTLIELIVVVAIIAILGAIAVPALLRAQIAANESSAIGSLRSVQSAEMGYHATGGGGGYALLLATLATRCPGSAQPFISSDLAIDPSVKSGYRISLQASTGGVAGRPDCNGTITQTGFYASAVPVAFPRSGRRGYATTAGATIFFDESGAPPTEAAMAAGTAQIIQ
jgi:prepilin-type N-terminal cleavage/methylation domain-containing protein